MSPRCSHSACLRYESANIQGTVALDRDLLRMHSTNDPSAAEWFDKRTIREERRKAHCEAFLKAS